MRLILSLTLLWAATPVIADAATAATTDAPVSKAMCTAPAGWTKPFTHVYHLRNGATLVFVGVEHTQDLTDATHRQIKAAFDHYRPQFVLVEGASSAKSVSDRYRTFLAIEARRRTDAGSASESLYAVRLASDNGAQFSGWDFSPDQEYRVLVEDGFAIEDALGAHLLRSHMDPFAGENGTGVVAQQVRYASVVVPVAAFDYAAWYRRAYGNRYDPVNGTPCGSGVASHAVSDLSYRRNLNLVALIDSDAQPGQTMLVEAGANHWLAIKDWIASRSINSD